MDGVVDYVVIFLNYSVCFFFFLDGVVGYAVVFSNSSVGHKNQTFQKTPPP